MSARGPRIHPRGRLVEEQEAGSADQRRRERQALRLTAGEAADRGAGGVAEADDVEQALRVVGVVVERGVEAQQLQRLEPRVEAALLEHDPDLGAQDRRVGVRIGAEDAHGAGVVRAVPLEDLDRRRLARRRSDPSRPKISPSAMVRSIPAERDALAVALLEAADLDGGSAHRMPSWPCGPGRAGPAPPARHRYVSVMAPLTGASPVAPRDEVAELGERRAGVLGDRRVGERGEALGHEPLDRGLDLAHRAAVDHQLLQRPRSPPR